jgi:hypothetical protein
MSKRRWLTAALAGAALAGAMVLVLALTGWSWTDARIGQSLANGMIFLGLGMIALAGLITNVRLAARSPAAAEPSSYN